MKIYRTLNNYNYAILLVILIFLANQSKSQNEEKEFFFWRDTSSGLVNHKVISIVESDNKELYILGKATDIDYKNPYPNYSRIDFKGKIMNTSNIYSQSVYDLNDLVILPNKKIRITGTVNNSGRFGQYIETLDKTGKIDPFIYSYNLVPTFSGNTFKAKDNKYVMSITTRNPEGGADDADPNSPGKLWNVWVYKNDLSNTDINLQKLWHIKLVSEYNEECIKCIETTGGELLVLTKRYLDVDFTRYAPIIYKISSIGKILWSKELLGFSDYNAASVVADKAGLIYIFASYDDYKMIYNQTDILLLNSTGDSLNSTSVDRLCASGGLMNSENKLLLYGKIYETDMGRGIVRATSYLLNNKLEIINSNSVDMFDPPDSEIPGMGYYTYACSSEFLTGILLTNGKIALGGRVYMPEYEGKTSTEIMNAERLNYNLIVFSKPNGDFGIYKAEKKTK